MTEALVKVAFAIGGLMTAAAYLVLLERRMAAWFQDRIGPNRVGIPLTRIRLWGLGQPLADGGKFILKEEYTPAHVDRTMYVLAPISILTAALAVFAVIPFGGALPSLDVGGLGWEHPVPLVVAPGADIGLVYVFALNSIAVYGVILGGWASNNKYSLLGGLRSSAQLIAYELPLGLAILGVVLASGSLNLDAIILSQASTGTWLAFSQPLGFVIFVVAAFAEAARLPFDLPECEQELIGGYHTEYSGIKLLLFLVAEFLHMITAAFLIVILFLGGWHLWGLTGATAETNWLTALLRTAVLLGKTLLVILFFMWVRWSWPRFRFDQLMAFAWKLLLPLGLAHFLVIAVLDQIRTYVLAPRLGETLSAWLLVIPGVGVCIAAWIVVGLTGPRDSTRPRRPGSAARGVSTA
ncbi:MAG: NADH-quinone oxidoreductase subunit NuoH [Planctomycetes bacterium]|nr:NADH-quinone oxidoreductase subunit NuoH [Planctomycetota bacterium]